MQWAFVYNKTVRIKQKHANSCQLSNSKVYLKLKDIFKLKVN